MPSRCRCTNKPILDSSDLRPSNVGVWIPRVPLRSLAFQPLDAILQAISEPASLLRHLSQLRSDSRMLLLVRDGA